MNRLDKYKLGWQRLLVPVVGFWFIGVGALIILFGVIPGVLETYLKECRVMHENCKRFNQRR